MFVALGVAALLAGFGVYRFGDGISNGASKIGNAATTVARRTDQTLEVVSAEVKQMTQFLTKEAWPYVNHTFEVIANEVKQTRQFLTEKAWPDVNRTLIKFEETLKFADHFIETATDSLTTTTEAVGRFLDRATDSLTITTKVIVLVLLLVGALICKMIILKTERRPRRHQTSALEKAILYLIFYVCLALAIVFVVEVIADLVSISSLGKGTSQTSYFIFIFLPSLAFLNVIFTFAKRILNGIVSLVATLISFFILKPLEWLNTPYSSGYKYFDGNVLSSVYHTLCTLIYCMLFIVLYMFYLALKMYEGFNSDSVCPASFKIALIMFILFCTLAFAIHVTFCALVSFCFRPIWAYSVKRKRK